ncbi:hypothetical protein [Bacteriovorax sp. BAL6_X]|uniref:hypothetical protein n=1 Tax=Bacteriovorax sp. BAL6_X TaxID=1201290 RepID=UPI0004273AFD|nr:hypothetical protein [Bacteriovorax sp. BAL6_X]
MQRFFRFIFAVTFLVSFLTVSLHFHENEHESNKLDQVCHICIKVSQFKYDSANSDLSHGLEASFLFLITESYQTSLGHTYKSLYIQAAPRGPPAHC